MPQYYAGKRVLAEGGRPAGITLRLCAGVIAADAWAGILINVMVAAAARHSLLAGIWRVLGYFTITTSLLSALVFTALAAGFAVPPRRMAGLVVCEILVGVVYALLLRGSAVLAGPALWADTMLHLILPVLAPLFWLAFVAKGRLRWQDPLIWALYPLAYLAYAILRGGAEHHYAYPFIDVARLGGARVAINAAAIATGFLLVSWLMVLLDRLLARRARQTR